MSVRLSAVGSQLPAAQGGIRCRIGDGRFEEVRPLRVVGRFAIHGTLSKTHRKWFTVTHIDSGLAAYCFTPNIEAAIDLAERCGEVEEWKRLSHTSKLKPRKGTNLSIASGLPKGLLQKMQAVVNRWYAGWME